MRGAAGTKRGRQAGAGGVSPRASSAPRRSSARSPRAGESVRVGHRQHAVRAGEVADLAADLELVQGPGGEQPEPRRRGQVSRGRAHARADQLAAHAEPQVEVAAQERPAALELGVDAPFGIGGLAARRRRGAPGRAPPPRTAARSTARSPRSWSARRSWVASASIRSSSAAAPLIASGSRATSSPGSLRPAYSAARTRRSPRGHAPRTVPPSCSRALRLSTPRPASQVEVRSSGGSPSIGRPSASTPRGSSRAPSPRAAPSQIRVPGVEASLEQRRGRDVERPAARRCPRPARARAASARRDRGRSRPAPHRSVEPRRANATVPCDSSDSPP